MKKQQAHLPYTPRPLPAVVDIALEQLPEAQRGHIQAICRVVKDHATVTEWEKWTDAAFVHAVRNALRAEDAEGLPRAFNVGGVYKPPTQMVFEDFVERAYEMAKRGKEMYGKAREMATLCAEKTGRTFDAEVVIRAATKGTPMDEVIAKLAS